MSVVNSRHNVSCCRGSRLGFGPEFRWHNNLTVFASTGGIVSIADIMETTAVGRYCAGFPTPVRHCAATSSRAGVGKPPRKEPAGCLVEDVPQVLWGFCRCLRHGQAATTPLREDVHQLMGVVM